MLISEQLVRRMIRWQLMEGKGGGKWVKYQRICGGEAQELYMLGHLMKWLQTVVKTFHAQSEMAQNLKSWIRDLQGYLDDPLKGWKQGNSRLKEIVQAMSQSDGLSRTRGGVARQLHIVLSNILQFSVLFLRSEGKNWHDINTAVAKISQERHEKGDEVLIYERLGSREGVLQLQDISVKSQESKSQDSKSQDVKDEFAEDEPDVLEKSQWRKNDGNKDEDVLTADDIIAKDKDVMKLFSALKDRRYSKREEILLKVKNNYEAILKKGEQGKYDNLNRSDRKTLHNTIRTYYNLLTGFEHELNPPEWGGEKYFYK